MSEPRRLKGVLSSSQLHCVVLLSKHFYAFALNHRSVFADCFFTQPFIFFFLFLFFPSSSSSSSVFPPAGTPSSLFLASPLWHLWGWLWMVVLSLKSHVSSDWLPSEWGAMKCQRRVWMDGWLRVRGVVRESFTASPKRARLHWLVTGRPMKMEFSWWSLMRHHLSPW